MQQPGEAYSADEANLESIAAVVVGGTSLSDGYRSFYSEFFWKWSEFIRSTIFLSKCF